jgi:quinoprotein relay system zinc metallohydrolase 2
MQHAWALGSDAPVSDGAPVLDPLTQTSPRGRLPLGRRQSLAGAFCLCCLPAQHPAGPPRFQEVAAGIHIRRGLDEDATAANQDAIANTGFIVGATSVLVTDPGGSLADGQALRAAISAATGKPVRYVLLSHVHPDHIFGAGAFAADDPRFIGHGNLRQALAARGPFYQSRLDAILGAGQAGPLIEPDLAVDGELQIDLGDRLLTLVAHPPAHTSSDVSLFDHATGTLLPADLLFVCRVPSLDGSLNGWLEQLASLAATKPARAIPGHGPVTVDFSGATADLIRYLTALRYETRGVIAAHRGIGAATATVAQSERRNWVLFDDYNPRNVTEAYRELEWE